MSRVKHTKRGSTYEVLGRGKVQTDTPLTDYAEVVIYRSEDDSMIWVRPISEFDDGRFEPLPADLTPPAADYVARLETALRMAKSSIENGGGGGVIDVVWCDGDIPETVCDHIETALAARPASPDTRVVTVGHLEMWAGLLEKTTYADDAEEIRVIIGGQDRG